MNQGQKIFHDFAMGRVQTGRETEMENMMSESFQRQDMGTFTMEYMNGIMPKMMDLLRPECVEEFKQAAAHMRTQIGNSAPAQN